MYGPPAATLDWSRSIRAVWARRLAAVARREGGDPDLSEAWALAAAEAWHRQWEVQAIVPLKDDPLGHLWAVVLRRGDEHEPPNVAFAHGMTPVEALMCSVKHLRAGIELSAVET